MWFNKIRNSLAQKITHRSSFAGNIRLTFEAGKGKVESGLSGTSSMSIVRLRLIESVVEIDVTDVREVLHVSVTEKSNDTCVGAGSGSSSFSGSEITRDINNQGEKFLPIVEVY